jgi:undecaprenyl-diphosphatase
MTESKTNWFRRSYGWVCEQDLFVLVAMLALVVGSWVFIELADEVMERETHALDKRIMQALRTPSDLSNPIGPPGLEEAMRDFTALGGTAVIILVTLTATGFVLMRRQFHALIFMVAAVGGGGILCGLFKGWFDRPRPEIVPHLMTVTSASFPSGHSLLSAVVYLSLAALLARLMESRRLKLYFISVALLITFLVGLSRVYLGVHYPTDVLAGWTVGLLWAIICWLTARFLQRRGTVERPS